MSAFSLSPRILNPVISSVRMISLLVFQNSIVAHLLSTFYLFTAQFDRNPFTTCVEHNMVIVVVYMMMVKLHVSQVPFILNIYRLGQN